MMTIIYMDVAAHTTVPDHQTTCCCLQEGRGGVHTHQVSDNCSVRQRSHKTNEYHASQ